MFFCQDDTDKSEMVKPFNNPKFLENLKLTSYTRFAQQIKQFQDIGARINFVYVPKKYM